MEITPYQPVQFLGSITRLTRTNQRWRRLAAAGFEVLMMPGTHFELLREPNVGLLARQSRSLIDAK
jgi:thioesterase domain-containing protein